MSDVSFNNLLIFTFSIFTMHFWFYTIYSALHTSMRESKSFFVNFPSVWMPWQRVNSKPECNLLSSWSNCLTCRSTRKFLAIGMKYSTKSTFLIDYKERSINLDNPKLAGQVEINQQLLCCFVCLILTAGGRTTAGQARWDPLIFSAPCLDELWWFSAQEVVDAGSDAVNDSYPGTFC